MQKFFLILFSSTSFLLIAQIPTFGPRINKGELTNDDINEASGLAYSIINDGILWTHNDSGGENRIFAIDTNGVSIGEFYLKDIENRDWEDICVGPGPDENTSYIYIGDVGDNDGTHKNKYIYRVVEPFIGNRTDFVDTLIDISTIRFTYPDDDRDAETIFIDPLTKDLYIVGKRDSKIRLYKLSFPQSTTSKIEAELEVKFSLPNDPESDTPNNYLTSGDISNDGTEVLIKSYNHIYYWKRENGASVSETVANESSILAYDTEPQGEAICWKPYRDKGYYTLSEEVDVTFGETTITFQAQLYYYPRKQVATSIKKIIPQKIQLLQNFPNPFNPATTISYRLAQKENVKLLVYNSAGEMISVLVNENQPSGNYSYDFKAKDLSSGIYFYKITTDSYTKTKKMIFLK